MRYNPVSRLSFGQQALKGGRYALDRYEGIREDSRYEDQSMSDFERELYPLAQEAKQERDEKFHWLQPVEFIFDLLSRGTYMSANLTDAVITSVKEGASAGEALKNVGIGLWQGLTGKKKGTYSDVLEEHLPEDNILQNKVFANRDEQKIFGNMQWTDLVGFAGDVLLDPLTYLSFGTTTAAKGVAGKYADDAVRLFLKNPANLDDLARKAGMRIDDFSRIIRRNPEKTASLVQRFQGTDVAREIDKVWKRAFREGQRMTAERAATKMRSQFLNVQAPEQRKIVSDAVDNYLTKRVRARAKAGKIGSQEEVAKKIRNLTSSDRKWQLMDEINDVLSMKKSFNEISDDAFEAMTKDDNLRKLTEEFMDAPGSTFKNVLDDTLGDSNLEARYEKMSERGMNFLGKEMFKSVRPPGPIKKQFDSIREGLRNVLDTPRKPGRMSLADAWWAVMNSNKSPIGRVRKLLGFRNPYQKMLRIKERDAIAGVDEYLESEAKVVNNILQSHSDDVKQQYVKLKAYAESKAQVFKESGKGDFTFDNALRDYGLKGEQAEQLRKLNNDVAAYFDTMHMKEVHWAEQGFIKAPEYREEYLPFFYNSSEIRRGDNAMIGTAYAPYTHEKTKGLWDAAMEEKQVMKASGAADEMADKVIWEQNASHLVADLGEIMQNRVITHARTYQRVQLLEQFREFGIHVDELKGLNPEVAAALTNPQYFQKLGMTRIDDSALQGYIFDREVGDILARATDIVSSDKDLSMFAKTFDKYTQWWKAVATMSPGFHGRNFLSNTVTLFLKHGPKAFDPATHRDALVASWYVLWGRDSLKKIPGITDETITNIITKRSYGGHTLEELAEYAQQKGIISKVTRGFDQEHTARQLLHGEEATWKPWSREFGGFKASEKVGQAVEGTSKMQSFLLDVQKMAGDRRASEAMVEMAKMETKKWFIDYTDLTEFERKVLKRMVPFYTWMRKNIGNQISMLMAPEYWGRMSMMPKALDMVQDDEAQPDRSLMREYMIEGGYTAVGEGEEGPIFFWPNIPIYDLNRIPLLFEGGGLKTKLSGKEVLSDLIQSSHPALKTFVEQITGYDTFREEKMKRQESMPRLLGLLSQVPRATLLVDGINRRMGGKGIFQDVEEDGTPQISGRMARLLENMFPILRQFERYIDGPEEVGKLIAEDFERHTTKVMNAEDQYDGMKETLKTISFWTGIKLTELDEDMAKSFANQEVYEEAMKRRYLSRKDNPLHDRRSREYWKEMKDRYRKLGLY